ncbi:MAG: formamidopyrimidine-DNA glycosylase [Actinobacteria bacterium]|nr:formamidopyrimidine-DNA glycosylase [Actinomycetota bacterium]MBV9932869.1 formamidopyrimidine-DNA glycosylase [Actinomycetota bacterium]
MPEMVEVEYYRRLAEDALDRTIVQVAAPDAWYLKRGLTKRALTAALKGRSFVAARRIGKLLLLDVSDDGPTLGLRFGMSGKLVVDGTAGIDDLIYSSNLALKKWDRFGVRFADGGHLLIRDPRRLGGVELDPPEDRLGHDASVVTPAALRQALESSAPLKARLMDQAHLAGVGNLIADETLWRAGLDPARPARSLDANEVRRLHRHLRRTVDDLLARGGSHTGDFLPHRRPGGACPKDGTPLVRRTVGGRTTWSCPKHQQ